MINSKYATAMKNNSFLLINDCLHLQICSPIIWLEAAHQQKKKVLIVDQWNVMARRTEIATKTETLKDIAQINQIIKILSSGCNKYMRIASLNDEGPEKQDQDVITIPLYDRLSGPVCRELISSIFKEIHPEEDDYTLIREIVNVSQRPGKSIQEKITNYRQARPWEIGKHLQAFYRKRIASLSYSPKEVKLVEGLRSKITAAIDLKIPVDGAGGVDPFYFDQRYLYATESDLIKSVFPAVTQAYRLLYY